MVPRLVLPRQNHCCATLPVRVLVLLRALEGEVYLKRYPSNSALHSGGALQALCNAQRDVTSRPLAVNNPPLPEFMFSLEEEEREQTGPWVRFTDFLSGLGGELQNVHSKRKARFSHLGSGC